MIFNEIDIPVWVIEELKLIHPDKSFPWIIRHGLKEYIKQSKAQIVQGERNEKVPKR